jgi:hypothetical protein
LSHDEEVSHLLESLIRMVGRANQTVDSLQKRVSQLEWLIRELQFETNRQNFFEANSQNLFEANRQNS